MLPFQPPSSRQDLVIVDFIYSDSPIRLDSTNDAVLIDLIASPTFQRLREVAQHGISALSGHLKGPRVTRFDHSIGAALLVRLLGASMEEQVAALLHDVAHTALSHVVDSVFNRIIHEEDKHVFLDQSDIPSIILAHGFNPDRVLNEENFSLLERPSPKLCADRCDYGLRDSVSFGIISVTQARMVFQDFVDVEGEITFKSVDLARLFALSYMEADRRCWSSPTHSLLYIFAANAIREAFAVKQLSHAQLWTYASDDAFWHDMLHSPHEKVRALAAKVTPNVEAKETPPPSRGQSDSKFTIAFESKARTIDPAVIAADGTKTVLSALDPSFGEILRSYRESKKGLKYYTVVDDRA